MLATPQTEPRSSRAASGTPLRTSLLRPSVPQMKLEVGAPDDRFEREAERIADLVVRTPEPAPGAPAAACGPSRIQRQCAECEEEEEERLQRSPTPGGREAAPGFEGPVRAVRGGGRPMSRSERAYYEPRFGCDFSQIRIHEGARADAAARAVKARAAPRLQRTIGDGHDLTAPRFALDPVLEDVYDGRGY